MRIQHIRQRLSYRTLYFILQGWRRYLPILTIWMVPWISLGSPDIPRLEPELYFSETLVSFRPLFLRAIESAQNRIDLFLFELSDSRLIEALEYQMQQGVDLYLHLDSSSPPLPSALEACRITHPISGLFHDKLLCIDSEDCWIGSANWTPSSLGINENSMIHCVSQELVDSIRQASVHHYFMSGSQRIEFWQLPNPHGLDTVLHQLRSAQHSILIACYAFTHPKLIFECILAHHRGIEVTLVLDRQMSAHINHSAILELQHAGVAVRTSRGMGCFHHKFCWVDDALILGSPNWTRAGFSKNHESFLIVHELLPKQKKLLRRVWSLILAMSEPLDEEHM